MRDVQAAGATGLFTAFQANDGKGARGRWGLALLAALVPVVMGVGFWVLAKGEESTFRVVTPHGIKSVRGGMTAEQVVALLGRPMTLERDATGAECYRYGRPTMVEPEFLVYSVCYEDGKLRDVTQRKFSAWAVDPATGTFVPPAGAARDAQPTKG